MPRLKPTRLIHPIMLLAVLLVPAPAHAQDQRLRISVGGATTAGAIDAQPAIVASVGYRFTDRFSFDVEVTAADDSAGRFSGGPIAGALGGPGGVFRRGTMMADSRGGPPVRPAAGGAFNQRLPTGLPGDVRIEREGGTALATVGFRYHFPSQVPRFTPYVSGSIGVARREATFTVSPGSGATARPGMNVAAPTSALPNVGIGGTRSHTGLATSAGVGASVRIFKQLSADLDARYFRLDGGRNLGRFGGGVSYRF